jgi:hypothetical protein
MLSRYLVVGTEPMAKVHMSPAQVGSTYRIVAGLAIQRYVPAHLARFLCCFSSPLAASLPQVRSVPREC